jgi:PadR family transcriptional regulator, regulatory protein PadR
MPTDNDKVTSNWMKEAHKGYTRIGILILLNKKPSHGYELMKEIKDRTKGFWTPTPGGVYPVLRSLEKEKYIKGEWSTQNNRKIRTYKITSLGKTILQKALIKQREITDNINTLFKDFSVDVLEIKTDSLQMPKMPMPFSVFLEEEKNKIDVKTLEEQKNHILQSIKMHQERLTEINKMLTEEKRKQTQQI